LKTIKKAGDYTTIEVPESFVNHSNTAATNVNNALSGVIQNSKLGEFMNTAGLAMAKLPPGLNIPTSIIGGAIRTGAKAMQDNAQRGSVQRTLNPFGSALSGADPNSVAKLGGFGAILGNQYTPKQ